MARSSTIIQVGRSHNPYLDVTVGGVRACVRACARACARVCVCVRTSYGFLFHVVQLFKTSTSRLKSHSVIFKCLPITVSF